MADADFFKKHCFDILNDVYDQDLNSNSRCRFTAASFQSEPSRTSEYGIRNATVLKVTGFDLAGPLHLKDKKKYWIVHMKFIERYNRN